MAASSKQYLKIPKLRKRVHHVPTGQPRFVRAYPNRQTETLCMKTFIPPSSIPPGHP